MKKIVLIYGLLVSTMIASSSYFTLWAVGDSATHLNSEWLGYLLMIVGLSLIFVAIKQHRDKDLGGIISLGKAFQVGLYISLITGVFYVASWELYYQNSDQTFLADYQRGQLENLQENGALDSEIQLAKKEMDEFAEKYENIFFRMLITLMEIIPVGLIVSLLCSFLLRTKR